MNAETLLPGEAISNVKTLGEIMSRRLIEVSPTASIGAAAELMGEARISSLLVVENDAAVGIVTERDILRAFTSGLEPQGVAVHEIMSSPVVSADEAMDYREVYRLLMRHNVRHLLVVDGTGQRVGIISESNLKSHIGIEFFVRMREVRGAMTARVITLEERATVGEAAALMEKHRIGCIVVVRERRPLGIVTERDMVRLYRRGKAIIEAPLAEVMSAPVRTVNADSSLQAAVQLMQDKAIRRVVVVDDEGTLAGLLTQHDIVKRLEGEYVDEFIAERRRIEAELQKTQAHLAHVLNVSPAATYVMRAAAPGGELEFAYATEQIVRISGYSLSEMALPGFWANGLHPDDHATALTNQDKLRCTGRLEHEYRFRHKLGHWIWIEDRLVAVRDDHGHLIEIVGSWLDVTERKQAEGRLARERILLRSLIDTIPDLVFVKDTHGVYLMCNKALEAFHGRSEQQILGHDDYELFPKEFANEIRDRDCHVYSSKTPVAIEEALTTAAGQKIVAEVIKMPFYAANGELLGLIGIGRDITARKEAEQALRVMNETLESKIAQELAKNREKDHLLIRQARSAALGEMLANIAHQWRQPLNTLALILSNIKDAHEFNELTATYLDEAMAKGQTVIRKMSATIDDFRSFFNPDKATVRARLLPIVENALSLMEASLTSQGVATEVRGAPDVEAQVLPNELAQVVLNLLANAKEAIATRKVAQGKITLEVLRDGAEACLRIGDNGGGVATEILPKIFDPYFTTKAKGTGIGLYMSKNIVEQMGGRLDAANLGDGLQMTIRLPLAG